MIDGMNKCCGHENLLREVLLHGAVKCYDVMVMQLVKHLPAHLAVADQAGGAQGAELVGNGGFGHAELGGEIADAALLHGKQGNEPQPRGIGQGGEELRHFLRLAQSQRLQREGGRMVVVVLRADGGFLLRRLR